MARSRGGENGPPILALVFAQFDNDAPSKSPAACHNNGQTNGQETDGLCAATRQWVLPDDERVFRLTSSMYRVRRNKQAC
jgi:hypothetical protein